MVQQLVLLLQRLEHHRDQLDLVAPNVAQMIVP